MASVQRVYNAVKDIANKDQRGFITPAIFNQFASVAQMNVYNRLFDQIVAGNKLRRAQVDGPRQFARAKEVQEDLSTFSKKATISVVSGVADKPSDFARVISIGTVSSIVFGVPKQTLFQVVYNSDHIDYIINSDLSRPSDSAPVALIGNQIEVFASANTNISSIQLRYYKLPQGIVPTTNGKTTASPKYGYTSTIPGVELYSAPNSVDFELPEQYFADLVQEVLMLVGVNLRDADVFNYAQLEVTKEENN
jgi:hypothetical protein|tara:strand:+ start:3718 stop:4470 length:753 start_codon:yes stop_codon:yes gene_type:complete